MSLDANIDLDVLTDGAAGLDDEYGISPGQSSRLAERIMAEASRHGGPAETPTPRPDGNPHLSGPHYDGLGR